MAKSGAPLSLLLPPLFVVAVLAVSLLLGSATEGLVAVQLYGGPTDSSEGFRGRLRLVTQKRGQPRPMREAALSLKVRQHDQVIEHRLQTDSEGWVEFAFPRTPEVGLGLQVSTEKGERLMNSEIALATSEWAKRARIRGLGEREIGKDPLVLKLKVRGGVLAVPFESTIALDLQEGGVGLGGARLRLTGRGGRLVGPTERNTDSKGHLELRFFPEEHTVSLGIEVFREEHSLQFEQALPVVPGAFSLARRGEAWVIRSPIVRKHVWYTLVTKGSRRGGGRVSLTAIANGESEGILPPFESPLPDDAYMVLSGDPVGLSLGTVGIPLSGQGRTLDVSDLLLVDTLPRAMAEATAKDQRIRFLLGVYVLIAGLVTLGLFSLYLRRAEQTLERGLSRVGATPLAKEASLLPIFSAIVSLFFAFSLAVLWIVAR